MLLAELLKSTDTICIVRKNAFTSAFLGAVGVGVTVTTMNPTYRPEEIARQLENSGAR
jgi:acyl-CoA synthetase (AMP-forming)/AMP-acid ligase II